MNHRYHPETEKHHPSKRPLRAPLRPYCRSFCLPESWRYSCERLLGEEKPLKNSQRSLSHLQTPSPTHRCARRCERWQFVGAETTPIHERRLLCPVIC